MNLFYFIDADVAAALDDLNSAANTAEELYSALKSKSHSNVPENFEGEAATAFIEEVDNRLNNEVQELLEAIKDMQSSLGFCVNRIERAEDEVRQIADELSSFFDTVIKF